MSVSEIVARLLPNAIYTLIRIFATWRPRLVLGLIAIPLSQASALAITVVVGDTLNRLSSLTETSVIRESVYLILIYALGNAVCQFAQSAFLAKVGYDFEKDLKQHVLEKVLGCPVRFHDENQTGDLLIRLTSDIHILRVYFATGLIYSFGAALLVPMSVVVLLAINWWLTLILLCPMGAIAIAMVVPTIRMRGVALDGQHRLAQLCQVAQESFAAIRGLRAYSAEKWRVKLFMHESERYMGSQIQLGRLNAFTFAAERAASELTLIVVLIIGGLAVLERQMLLGDLFKFVDISLKAFLPLTGMGWIMGMTPRAQAAAERIHTFVDKQPYVRSHGRVSRSTALNGSIELKDVSYSHHPPKLALQAITLSIPPGTKLAILGPTGSGKTTLLEVILGLVPATSGNVEVNGQRVEPAASGRSVSQSMAYVPQTARLFSETYRWNLSFGSTSTLSKAKCLDVIRRVGMTSDVGHFPDGLNEVLGESGLTLSGGQRQRTCVARALARNPSILLLDDCISSVDAETEAWLLEHVVLSDPRQTVLFVTNRCSVASSADCVLIMRDGRVDAVGSHSNVLGRNPWYRAMWSQQSYERSLQR